MYSRGAANQIAKLVAIVVKNAIHRAKPYAVDEYTQNKMMLSTE